MQALRPQSFSGPASGPLTTPTQVPALVYRVHRDSCQTKYSFGTGFSAKNHTTIINQASLIEKFGLAHLTRQTNISSPFISVYDSAAHANQVARYLTMKYGEDTKVVEIDTRRFARGPPFRAADILKNIPQSDEDKFLHQGEYMLMYTIPREALVVETKVGFGVDTKRRAVGVIGGGIS